MLLGGCEEPKANKNQDPFQISVKHPDVHEHQRSAEAASEPELERWRRGQWLIIGKRGQKDGEVKADSQSKYHASGHN